MRGDLIVGLIVGLIVTAITFLAAVPYARVRRWSELQRPGRRVWRLPRGAAVSIVTAEGPEPDSTEYTITVYPAEYAAATEIAHYLGSELRCDVERICTSSEFPPDHAIRGNLVLIGGPVHSPLTRMMLERTQVPFHFEEYTLVNSQSGERFDAEIKDGVVTSDVALVVVTDNPFNPSNRVVMVAGCRTYGCIAGARQLIYPAVLRISRKVANSSYFVVRSEVLGRYVSEAQVLATGSI
jgi:hypothetical protein